MLVRRQRDYWQMAEADVGRPSVYEYPLRPRIGDTVRVHRLDKQRESRIATTVTVATKDIKTLAVLTKEAERRGGKSSIVDVDWMIGAEDTRSTESRHQATASRYSGTATGPTETALRRTCRIQNGTSPASAAVLT